MQIEIPGGTAEIRDKANTRTKKALKAAFADVIEVLKRKYSGDITKIKDASPEEIRSDGELVDISDDFAMRALTVLLISWTRPEAMPTTVLEWLDWEDPDDCPNLYDQLCARITPTAYGFLGSGINVSPETVRDPESPTELSSGLSEGELDLTTLTTPLPVG